MTRAARTIRAVVWVAVALQAAVLVVRVVVEVRLLHLGASSTGTFAAALAEVLATAAFPAVGVVIVRRQPAQVVGWLFCVANVGWIVNTTIRAHVQVSAAAGALPPADVIVWPFTWAGFTSAAFYILLVLWFPTGHAVTRRWRTVGRVTVVAMVVAAVAAALAPGPIDPSLGIAVENPFGIDAPGVGRLLYEVSTFGYPAAILLQVAAICSAGVRYRRASGVERLQLKWFAVGLAAWALLLGVYLAVALAYPSWDFPFWARGAELAAHLGAGIFPIAAGIAILRYRLYEIDGIVSRTISYALLTAGLAGIYTTGVVGLGTVLREVAGVEAGDLVVAGSTLAAAAAFRPARRRLQRSVDRRFHRARFDAQRTVEAFAQSLRDEVDLSALAAETRRVAAGTLQPTTLSLWLRDPAPGARSTARRDP